MINIREEDVKIFEQNGFTKEDVGKAVEHYRRQGMSDDKIQKRMNFRVSALRDNDTQRLLATDPNISQQEKAKRVNTYGAVEQAQYTPENARREYAIQKQAEIAKRKEAHPFAYGMNAMFNPIAGANDYYLQKMAENGQVGAGDIAKMGGMGLLTGAGDALMFTGAGAAAKLGQGTYAANAARATAAARAANMARNAGNIQKATQFENVAKGLDLANTGIKVGRGALGGAAGFASPVAGEQFGQVVAGNETPMEALKHTARAAGEGAVLGTLGMGSHALVSKVSGLNVRNVVANTLEKQGKNVSEELIDKWIAEHPYLYNIAEAKVNTLKAVPTTAVDTAALGAMDYKLNQLEGTQEQSFGEHMSNYLPFLGFGAIPGLVSGAKMVGRGVGSIPAVQRAGNAVNNAIENSSVLSNLKGTGALSLGLEKPKGIAGEYYDLESALQALKDDPHNTLSPEQISNLTEVFEKLTPEQRREFMETFQKGGEEYSYPGEETKPQEPSKFEQFKAEAEAEQKITPEEKENALNNKPSEPNIDEQIKQEYEGYNALKEEIGDTSEFTLDDYIKQYYPEHANKEVVKPKAIEAPLTKENESVGINTPKEDLTHVNEPSTVSENSKQLSLGLDKLKKQEIVPNENAEPIVKDIKTNYKNAKSTATKQATQKTVEGSVNKSKAYRDLYNKKISKVSGKMREVPEEFKPEENTEDISKFKVTKLEGGAAEGSDYLYKKDKIYDKKTENTTKNVKAEKEAFEKENQVWENGSSERTAGEVEGQETTRKYNEFDRDKEQITGESKYVTTDKELIKWWDKYKKLPDKKRNAELVNKWKNLKPEKQDEFMDFVSKQEERDAVLAKNEYNEKASKGIITDNKPDTSSVKEIGRLGQAIKEGHVKIDNAEKQFSNSDIDYGNKIIKTLFKNSDKNIVNPVNKIKYSFKKFKNGKKVDVEKAQAAYDEYATKISRMKKYEGAKEYALSLINDVAKKYGVKTRSSAINKTRVNEVLDSIKKYTEEFDKASEFTDEGKKIRGNALGKLVTYLKENDSLLKEQKQYKGNDVVAEAYYRIAENKLKRIYRALADGDFKTAEKLWKESENNIRAAYTDFSIRERYNQNRETGKYERKGESWNNEVTDIDIRDREYLEHKNDIENEIREGFKQQAIKEKKEIVKDYFDNGNVSEKLEGLEIKANEFKEIMPELEPFINKAQNAKIKFVKPEQEGLNSTFVPSENTIEIYIGKNKAGTLEHEHQHGVDFQDMYINIGDKDVQVFVKAELLRVENKQKFISEHPEEYKKAHEIYKKCKDIDSIQKELNNIKDTNKRNLVEDGIEHLQKYMDSTVETRGFNAKKTRKPCEKSIVEEIKEIKQNDPERWKELEEAATTYDSLYGQYRGNGIKEYFKGYNSKTIESITKKPVERTPERPIEEKEYTSHEVKETKKPVRVTKGVELTYSKDENGVMHKKVTQNGVKYDIKYDENGNEIDREAFISKARFAEEDVINKLKEAETPTHFNAEQFEGIKKQYIPLLRKISREIDKMAIELGYLTREQVENRNKQLGGYYYPTHKDLKNAQSTKGIDLFKDYTGSRDDKVGLFGKATKNRTNAENEVYQAAKNLFVKYAKYKYALNVKNSIKKIGRAYKEGSVGKGEVAVNTDLLSNAVWSNMSREFFDTVAKGEFDKITNNKEQRAYLKGLHERTGTPDVIIPEHLLNKVLDGSGETLREHIERYGGGNIATLKKAASTALNISNDFFKRRVLGTASFFINNRMGNQLMIAANSEDPVEYVKSLFNARKLKTSDVPMQILENSIAEAFESTTKRRIYTGYDKVDNVLNVLKGETIKLDNIKPGLKKDAAVLANLGIAFPNKAYNKIADSILEFNTKCENFERKQLFAQHIERTKRDLIKKTGRRMITTEEVIKHINSTPALRETIIKNIQDVLGDYSKFSKFERKYLKTVVPFYSWYRTITRHTLQLARKNPARFGLIVWQLKKMADDDSDLKKYQRGLGSFRLPFKDSRSGKQLVINKSRQVPWNTFGEIAEPDGKMSMTAPMIRTTSEAIRGKKWFNDSEITNNRYIREEKYNPNKDAKKEYHYYDTKTGKYIDKLPATTRVGYVAKEAFRDLNPLFYNNVTNLEGAFSALNRYRKTGEFAEPDKSYDASLGGFRSGDIVGKKWSKKNGYKDITRYAANNTSGLTKRISATLGLSLGNKTELNKAEREQRDKDIARKQEKYNKKRKKAS